MISEELVWRVAYGVLLALHDCHNRSEKILHRDLKPANVFLDKEGNIKVGECPPALEQRCAHDVSPCCLLLFPPAALYQATSAWPACCAWARCSHTPTWARLSTCLPNRLTRRPTTRSPTSGPLAACFTRCARSGTLPTVGLQGRLLLLLGSGGLFAVDITALSSHECLFLLPPFHSPPFDATNQIALAMKIRAGKTNRIPSPFSEDLWKVIRYMLQVEVCSLLCGSSCLAATPPL